jgi:hypothetical protein
MYKYLKRFSVPHIYFYEGGGAKLYSQIGWGAMAGLAPPGSATGDDRPLIDPPLN